MTRKVFIAGHLGMVGSAIHRKIDSSKYHIITKTKEELNLISQREVTSFFENNDIDLVFIAAARVGGIMANNNQPANFIYENLMIQTNIIHSSHLAGIERLIFLGSSCLYPKFSKQPIKEEYLLTGKLEPTNDAYAIAKIAGIKMCESYNKQHNRDYRSFMPTNLYGINDNFDPVQSHVLPALIHKIHEAKVKNFDSVMLWGDGTARREFLFTDDLADCIIKLANLDQKTYWDKLGSNSSHLNIGTGEDISIAELAILIKNIVGYSGNIQFDTSMPNGTPKKQLDVTNLRRFDWQPTIKLEEGIKIVYEWYQNNNLDVQ